MSTHQKKFVGLDGMRGLAALAVMALHYRDYFFYSAKPPVPLVPNAGTAVDLFFVLSGFVLAYAYERRFAEGLGTAKFMALRLVRIYPLYFIGTALAVLVDIIFWRVYWEHAAPPLAKAAEYGTGLLFVPLFCAGCRFFPFNFPAWSLLIELIANFIYRAFYKLLSSTGLLLLALACFAGIVLTANRENDLGMGYLIPDLFRVGFSFPMGIVLYRVWSRGKFRPSIHPLVPIAVMAALFYLPNQFGAFLATLAIFPALIYLAACNEPRGAASKIWSEMGAMSFAVYMLHIPTLQLYKLVERKFPADLILPPMVPYLGLMLTVMVAAALADRIYDIPVRKMLNDWILKRRRPNLAARAAE